jgi:hypothetical protein
MINERLLRRALIVFALAALGGGLMASSLGRAELANWLWVIGTIPVIVTLFVSMLRVNTGGRHDASTERKAPERIAGEGIFGGLAFRGQGAERNTRGKCTRCHCTGAHSLLHEG